MPASAGTLLPVDAGFIVARKKVKSIFEYDTRSEGAKAYVGLVKEVIAQNEKR